MQPMDRIRELAAAHGMDFAGAAGITGVQQAIRETGGELAAGFPRALSVGIVLPMAVVDLLRDRDVYENVLQYKIHAYDVINRRLDDFCSLAACFLQREGYRVMPIPASERIDNKRVCASVSHKMIARLAGFGWIGKNCLLITPQYGPRVRWATVLTDAPLPENGGIMDSRCGDCDRCSAACPAGALHNRAFSEAEPREARLDMDRCEAYYDSLAAAGRMKFCGMCLYVCPYGAR